ncbi:MAG: iron-containing alcohol dehydrogenase, partial [Gammaproteobacteria bacterium]
MFNAFSIARLPRIEFGNGVFNKIVPVCAQYGHKVLLVTGASSFSNSTYFEKLVSDLAVHNMQWQQCTVATEPSPQLVDEAVKQFAEGDFDVVLGIGGGSALDAAKAIAGLLKVKRSVMDY